MQQQTHSPWLVCLPPFLTQILAISVTPLDGGKSQNACFLASAPFWACALFILARYDDRLPRLGLLFIRWGLIAFILIGAPVLYYLLGLAERFSN
jgi:hypothetical protein